MPIDLFEEQNDLFSGNPPPIEPSAVEKFYRASGIHGANKAFANIFGFGQHVKNANAAAKKARETNPIATGIGEISGDIVGSVPFFMAGGAAAGSIPQLGATGARILGAGLGGGLLGAIESQPDDKTRAVNSLENGLLAAGIETVLPYAGRFAKKVMPALTPTSWVAKKVGTALPESQILENAAISQGVETPIGDVVGSGYLKKMYENSIAPYAGATADDAYARAGTELAERGKNILARLSKSSAGKDINLDIKDTLRAAYEQQRQIKNAMYDTVSDLAVAENFKLKLPGTAKLARDVAGTIEDSPLLKTDPDIRAIFNKVFAYQNPTKNDMSVILGPNGKPLISKVIYPTIKEANYLASAFNDAANAAIESPAAGDRAIAGLYKKFANLLRNDVRTQIEKNGTPEIREAYQKATENYKKNFSPFLDKDYYKLIQGNKPADAIARQIIQPGKGDKFSRIKNIQQLLPEEKRNALAAAFLEEAVDKTYGINPQSMSTLIKGLGKRQMEALFPDATLRKEILDYQRLVNMNSEAVKRLFNPNTGQRGITSLQQGLKQNLGAVGMATGLMASGAPLGAILSMAGNALPNAVAKPLAKAFTSEAARKKIIDKIIKKKVRTKTDEFLLSILTNTSQMISNSPPEEETANAPIDLFEGL